MFTGTSGSLLLHPSEFIESRKDADAMRESSCLVILTQEVWVGRALEAEPEGGTKPVCAG